MSNRGDGLTISCILAPSTKTPEHIVLAEMLGYTRAWCFDSPALYADVWMVLARAAQLTEQIGLGPGVLVPHLRHPMVTASAIGGLCEWAPGRVNVAIGSGFTGRLTMGQRPMHWSDVKAYVVALRALLQGEEHEWEGAPMQMLHRPGFGAARPIDVPIIVAVDGPRSTAVAGEVADGVISPIPTRLASNNAARRILMSWGTVLSEGETFETPRVRAATTPGMAVIYHVSYGKGPEALGGLPGGEAFGAAADAIPAAARHLALHEGHFVEPNQLDQYPLQAYEALVPKISLTGDAEQVRQKIGRFAEMGITELAYQPIGPDIEHELRTFASVALKG